MTAPVSPLELRGPLPPDELRSAAMDKAMKAALKGDFSALDKLEMDYLNLLVRIGDFWIKHPDGQLHWWFDPFDVRHQSLEPPAATHAPFVIAIRRAYTKDARTALEWALQEKCRRCDGKLRRLPCRACNGAWYVEDMSDHELVYTDVDGVLIGDGEEEQAEADGDRAGDFHALAPLARVTHERRVPRPSAEGLDLAHAVLVAAVAIHDPPPEHPDDAAHPVIARDHVTRQRIAAQPPLSHCAVARAAFDCDEPRAAALAALCGSVFVLVGMRTLFA